MLAQIAMMVHNANAKPSGRKKIKDFLLFRKRHRATNELDQAIVDAFGDS